MGSIGGIGAVQARIATIQARVGGVGATSVNGPLSTEVPGPSNPTAGFDPFGAAYQQALAAAGIVDPASDPTDPSSVGGSAIGGAVVDAPTGAPGDGTVAAFTPAEYASITGSSATDGSIGGAPTAGSPPVSPPTAGYSPTSAGRATVQTYAPSSGQTANQTINQTIGQIYGTVGSMTLDGTSPLTGPVYTGNSRLAGVSSASGSSGTDGYTAVSDQAFQGTGVRGASIGKIGGYGSMPVPSELLAYGNGQLPPTQLEPIGQGGHRLYAPAAASWRNAVADARADGIDLRITDSYRTFDEQVELAGRKGLYRNGGRAAVPGTSNHGWGMAVDVDVTDPTTMAWMRANGYRYGFVEAVPREPWHWEYRPSQA